MDRRLSGNEALFSGSTQIPSKSSINMVVRLSRRRRKDWILLSDHMQYKPTMSLCISVYMFVRFVGTDDLRSFVYGRWRLARRSALADPSQR